MNTAQFIPNSLALNIDQLSVTWKTPSNIALVKYWGKTEPQLPKNASISFTLSNSHTITTMEFDKKTSTDAIQFELYFEGEKKDEFKPKIAKFLDRINAYCPYLKSYHMTLHSSNSFPHSSGIASSASGMSAIAMCIMSLEQALSGGTLSQDFINRKASFLARLGSGSASRSVEGPLVVWGEHAAVPGSSDLYGVPFYEGLHPVFEDFQDTILLVDMGEKQVSSTVGHQLMYDHPFAKERFLQANENLDKMVAILREGALDDFIALVESEALTLHAMMLTSSPYFILMKPQTLEIINAIWSFRKETNINVCFTLDAGANVHVLYPKSVSKEVLAFIEKDLSQYCQKKQYICDSVGLGAQKLER